MLKKIICITVIIIISSFIMNNIINAQPNIIIKEITASGGILYSSNSQYYHSATLGEIIIGSTHNAQNSIISGFWSTGIITPTEVKWQANEQIPKTFELQQNYPNPFNPTTIIEYDLPSESLVNIVIFDITGRRVKKLVDSRTQGPGYIKSIWDGTNENGNRVGSGCYFIIANIFKNDSKDYRRDLVFRKVRKMLLIK